MSNDISLLNEAEEKKQPLIQTPRLGMLLSLSICCLAFLIRLVGINESFWIDEASTLKVIDQPFSNMFSSIWNGESTPPLSYILSWSWSKLFGLGEIASRLLPILLGVALVWMGMKVAERVAGKRAALLVGLLLAVNPFLVRYSYEARAYSLLALLSVCLLYFALRVKQSSTMRWSWAWSLTACLAIATHYFAVFVIVPTLIWMVIENGNWRKRTITLLPLIITTLGMAYMALHQRQTGRSDWISDSSLLTRSIRIFENLFTGLSAPHQMLLAALALLAVVLVGLLGIKYLVDNAKKTHLDFKLASQGIYNQLTPLVIGLSGIGVMIGLALFSVDLVLARNAIGSLACILVSVGILMSAATRSKNILLKIFTFALIGVVMVISLLGSLAPLSDPQYAKADWRGANKIVGDQPSLVIVQPKTSRIAYAQYQKNLRLFSGKNLQTNRIVLLQFRLNEQGAKQNIKAVKVPKDFVIDQQTIMPQIKISVYTSKAQQRVTIAALFPDKISTKEKGSINQIP